MTVLVPDAERLANYLWDPDPQRGPFRHVFFPDEIEETSIPWSVVRDHIGYDPEYFLQRLTVLDESRSESLLDVLSDFDPTLAEGIEPDRDPVQDRASDAAQESYESSQGFVSSTAVRDAIENHSMRRAEDFMERLGFESDDVSKTHSYDLRCERGDLTVHVEVKGTQSAGDRIFLTANEVEFAREHSERMILFVLHSIKVEEMENGDVEARGGEQVVHMPWNVDDGGLSVVNYRYSVPEK